MAGRGGTWRSPVAHFLGVEGVAGSNPVVPILYNVMYSLSPGHALGLCAFAVFPEAHRKQTATIRARLRAVPHGNALKQRTPDTFSAMYQFWCCRR